MRKPSKDSPQPETVWITIDDFEFICFNLARELLTFHEPIPDYNTRDNALLESALGSIRQTYNGKLLYPTLISQTAILFYSLIKNHPFQNGNKRIAVVSLIVFLALNKKWIDISPQGLYDLACLVSESESQEREHIIIETSKLLNEFVVDEKV